MYLENKVSTGFAQSHIVRCQPEVRSVSITLSRVISLKDDSNIRYVETLRLGRIPSGSPRPMLGTEEREGTPQQMEGKWHHPKMDRIECRTDVSG